VSLGQESRAVLKGGIFDFQEYFHPAAAEADCRRNQQDRKRAEEAQRQAQAIQGSYQEFGLLAEKISEDDFRVNMGDHRSIAATSLPPQFVKAALAMQAGQVSGVIQIENAFTIFRLNAHNPPQKQTLAAVKNDVRYRAAEEQVRTSAARIWPRAFVPRQRSRSCKP